MKSHYRVWSLEEEWFIYIWKVSITIWKVENQRRGRKGWKEQLETLAVIQEGVDGELDDSHPILMGLERSDWSKDVLGACAESTW